MNQRSKLCVLMLAVLLAGCRAADPGEESRAPEVSDRPAQSRGMRESETSRVSEEPSPEPTTEPGLWDPEHRLGIGFTPAEGLELPISGATGYATVELPLWGELPLGEEGRLATIYAPPEPSPEPSVEPSPEPSPAPTPEPGPMEGAMAVLEPGEAFTILNESGYWWQVRLKGGETGWVEHRYCLINLPDVIPSIVYRNTNAYSSLFVSSGKDIPNITGKALYQAEAQNPRLGRSEFMVPVLYAMAKNVCQAQQNALAEGNTLVLYEGFLPYDAQMAVARGLSALARSDSEVKAGISTAPWNISWFTTTGASNHQEGYAVDVSLAKVTGTRLDTIGGYSVVQVDEYEEYEMPTAVHELSMAAVTYTKPVAIFSTTAWRSAELAPAVAASEPAKALQRYCTEAKLTPLASEWWHFNDLAAYSQIRAYHSAGNFEITDCLSTAPG